MSECSSRLRCRQEIRLFFASWIHQWVSLVHWPCLQDPLCSPLGLMSIFFLLKNVPLCILSQGKLTHVTTNTCCLNNAVLQDFFLLSYHHVVPFFGAWAYYCVCSVQFRVGVAQMDLNTCRALKQIWNCVKKGEPAKSLQVCLSFYHISHKEEF